MVYSPSYWCEQLAVQPKPLDAKPSTGNGACEQPWHKRSDLRGIFALSAPGRKEDRLFTGYAKQWGA